MCPRVDILHILVLEAVQNVIRELNFVSPVVAHIAEHNQLALKIAPPIDDFDLDLVNR